MLRYRRSRVRAVTLRLMCYIDGTPSPYMSPVLRGRRNNGAKSQGVKLPSVRGDRQRRLTGGRLNDPAIVHRNPPALKAEDLDTSAGVRGRSRGSSVRRGPVTRRRRWCRGSATRSRRPRSGSCRPRGQVDDQQVPPLLQGIGQCRLSLRESTYFRGEAVKKLGQAPSRPLISQGFRRFRSEPVPFFHSLGAKDDSVVHLVSSPVDGSMARISMSLNRISNSPPGWICRAIWPFMPTLRRR
jgi:hypothetical protein